MFLQDLYERMEKDLDTISFSGEFKVDKSGQKETIVTSSDFNETVSESGSNTNKQTSDKGSKKKKGKSNNTHTNNNNNLDNQEPIGSKSKKNHRKGKAASSSDSKSSAKKDDDTPNIFSEEKLCEKINELVPDFEDQGDFFSFPFLLSYLPFLFTFFVIFYYF